MKGECQKHTIVAEKGDHGVYRAIWNLCQSSNTSHCEEYLIAHDTGMFWPILGVSGMRIKTLKPGVRVPGIVTFSLKYVSKTTILSTATYEDEKGIIMYLTIAFAAETSLSEEMYDEYLRMAKNMLIPVENIQELIKSVTMCHLSPV